MALTVDGPDVSFGVDPDAVRPHGDVLAPLLHQLTRRIEDPDIVGVAPEGVDVAFIIDGDPGHSTDVFRRSDPVLDHYVAGAYIGATGHAGLGRIGRRRPGALRDGTARYEELHDRVVLQGDRGLECRARSTHAPILCTADGIQIDTSLHQQLDGLQHHRLVSLENRPRPAGTHLDRRHQGRGNLLPPRRQIAALTSTVVHAVMHEHRIGSLLQESTHDSRSAETGGQPEWSGSHP